MSTDARRKAGKRLRAFVDDRMADASVGSLVELADRAPVSYDTLHAWFRGRPPSPTSGGRVAQVLGVTYSELLAAYEGRPVEARFVREDELEDLVMDAVRRALREYEARPRVPPLEELVAQGEELTARAGRQSLPRGVAPKRRSTDS